MTISKKIEILRAVAGLLDDGRFKYGGKHYRADQESVLQGLRITVDSTEPPLKNHNYLKAILSKKAGKLSAGGETAAEERERERRKSQRPEKEGFLDLEENKKRLARLAETIG